MKQKRTKTSILFAGILKENPVLVLLLGTCPTLAITTEAKNGLGMGMATLFVLVGSNLLISLVKNLIPDKVRIPSYIVIIAGMVTLVQMLIKAYAPEIDAALGIYLPLIVVNCIILGRAEMFASKNSVGDSVLDGIGMGLGFTVALLIIGSIREIIGAGSWFGIPLTKNLWDPMLLFLFPPGGFFVFGLVIAAVNRITKGKAIKKKSLGCGECGACSGCDAGEESAN